MAMVVNEDVVADEDVVVDKDMVVDEDVVVDLIRTLMNKNIVTVL